VAMQDVLDDGVYTTGWVGMVREDLSALIAASFPAKPPRQWFDDPKLPGVSALTIDNTGRVHGHIATWKQSHIGMAGSVKAPRSKSNYAFFATGALECDDGSHVNVGQITLAGGHASIEASVAETVAHYDNTRSAVMDVAVGEDRHGIWVAGALRPDVDDLQLRAVRASSVSGDWRPINGNLELVAVCSVNVPGFPIPRARVASGQVVALVAAGTEELVELSLQGRADDSLREVLNATTATIDARMRQLEDALLDRVRDNRQGLTAAIEEAKKPMRRGPAKGDRPPTSVAVVASADDLRARVHAGNTTWADGYDIAMPLQECIVASLRDRVQQPGVQASAKKWDAKGRKDAASKRQALPDGSFPITNKADWERAKQALGRAKNRARAVRHLKTRGRSLGISKEKLDAIKAATA